MEPFNHGENLFSISTAAAFEEKAFEVFQFQRNNLPIYQQFCKHLGISDSLNRIEDIPFLPISFFKQHALIHPKKKAEITFLSSGTTGSVRSTHYVADLNLYIESFTRAFERMYGHPSKYAFLALLPSYQEQGNSSLVFMIDYLIRNYGANGSGFFLNQNDQLLRTLDELEQRKQPTILFGVSYALLDLAERFEGSLRHTLIMETGGMKGRRKEMVREELHHQLKSAFGVSQIHSEYGMTELLSQAYSTGDGKYVCPPWMQISTRDTEDPLTQIKGATGGINIIDLANIYSCAFIATQDLGKVFPDGSFEILGRFDASDVRGCNLMVL